METYNVKAVALPGICPECNERIYKSIANAVPAMTEFYHHCPHHDTAIRTDHRMIGGYRTVTRWLIHAPCSEKQFTEMLDEIAEEGSELKTFHEGGLQ